MEICPVQWFMAVAQWPPAGASPPERGRYKAQRCGAASVIHDKPVSACGIRGDTESGAVTNDQDPGDLLNGGRGAHWAAQLEQEGYISLGPVTVRFSRRELAFGGGHIAILALKR
ncbi:hypothetical protein Vafri_16544 [Volvox africanus]|uniref:Uncharacterized protein n=1 Tax=Volvox africanus TaxID=51714 RepID=A0A8J4BHH1_9CHLO|nr:hypothetical protein Vafri_16544 [Volvox africanus]